MTARRLFYYVVLECQSSRITRTRTYIPPRLLGVGKGRGRGWDKGRGREWDKGRGREWDKGRGRGWDKGRGRGSLQPSHSEACTAQG